MPKTIFYIIFFIYSSSVTAQLNDKIIYESQVNTNRHIYMLDSNRKSAFFMVKGNSPTISPDKKLMAYILPEKEDAPGHIFIYDFQTRQSKELVAMLACNPQWSPDGKSILFEYFDKGKASIYIADAVTGLYKPFIPDAKNPSWSPDGKQIAFVRNYDIYTTQLNNPTTAKRIIKTDKIIEKLPVWSPDGKYIAYQVQINGGQKDENYIQLLNLKTGKKEKLIDHNPDYFSWADENNLLITIQDSNHFAQIARLNINDKSIQIMTSGEENHWWPLWVKE
jgi:Tol biopolymer transport system component